MQDSADADSLRSQGLSPPQAATGRQRLPDPIVQLGSCRPGGSQELSTIGSDLRIVARQWAAYARELEGSVPVAASHFPGLRFGRLLPGEEVQRWTFDG
jgi:hypothetical protein